MQQMFATQVAAAAVRLQESGTWPVFPLPQVVVERTSNPAHGDWTTNIAFALAKPLRQAPPVVAAALAAALQDTVPDAEIAAAGGYINLRLLPAAHQRTVAAILADGSSYGSLRQDTPSRVLLEYISANPTGPVHLGNARGGPYGDALANVLTKAGHDVAREYYVNDYGNQVTILGHSVIGDDQAQYAGDYIAALRTTLGADGVDPADARGTGRRAAALVVADIIRPALARAGIAFDRWFSEASLHESGAVDRVVAALAAAGCTYEADDATFFRSTAYGDEKDRVLVKKDGEKTYFCADVAYHLDKAARADRLIDIWGADHGGTVARLRGALAALGHPGVLDVILTQFVRVMEDGVEVKMSKRRGTYITLEDLVDDVGPDVVRFLFLMQAATSHVVFDLDRAREQSDKNPVFYVQYAHARIRGILRKAAAAGVDQPPLPGDLALLTHDREIALMRVLGEFPEIVARAAADYGVHRLPHYAIALADHFHSFYAACTVIDPADAATTRARLALATATATVLAETLRLVGVAAPDRM